MLQKFAFALKTKTAELFADDEDDAAGGGGGDGDGDDDGDELDLAELIPNQRVIILKPDPPPLPHLLPALLASFSAAHLLLQSARAPLSPAALTAADRSAVSALRRLSDLKQTQHSLTAFLESQVHDNQSLLRSFDAFTNHLQLTIDRKDSLAAALKESISSLEADTDRLSQRLDSGAETLDTLLSVSVFDGVLKDCCRVAHRFSRLLVGVMERSGWELGSAAESIHPGVVYAKPGHCKYAVLSYVCLRMFQGFETVDFGSCGDQRHQRTRSGSLREFIEHSAVDPMEVVGRHPECGFSVFCKRKYEELVNLGMGCSLFGDEETLQASSALYEPFISMASAVWTLHKLGWAYDPVVGIFQVGRGKEFSMVYMERVGKSGGSRKVGFTVIPGFRVGKTVIQCRVYLDGL